MAGIAYENSLTTGHSTAPPTNLISSQDLVTVDGKKVIVDGDKIIPHAYHDDPPHNGHVIASGDVVYIMGKAVAQIGDPISCGDTVSEGSSISRLR